MLKVDFKLLDCRAEVKCFAVLMEHVLRRHDDAKGESWRKMSLDDLAVRVQEEVQELLFAIETGSPYETMVTESVDVANFCMFITDIAAKAHDAQKES